jgi:ERCC4-type nuclease
MHPRAIATKRVEAQRDLMAVAASIGEKCNIENATEKVQGPTHRDKQVQSLRQDEALVSFLREVDEALAGSGDASPEEALEDIDGINPEIAEELRSMGFDSPDDLNEASDDELLAVDGIGPARLERIRKALG